LSEVALLGEDEERFDVCEFHNQTLRALVTQSAPPMGSGALAAGQSAGA
jgi:hypothetical protein